MNRHRVHYFHYIVWRKVVSGWAADASPCGRGSGAQDEPPSPARPASSGADRLLERTLRKNRTEVTFVLPADTPPGPVSMVGDFNDWRPGIHTLAPRKDGKRAVTVTLPSESSHSFRYLAAWDYWFNDESAGDQEGSNSRLHT